MWHVPFHLFADYDNTVNVRALCLVNVAVVSVFISYLIYYLPYCPPTHFNFIHNPFSISMLPHISRLYGPCPATIIKQLFHLFVCAMHHHPRSPLHDTLSE